MEHPKEEKTFVLIKIDGVQRSLVGEIIGRIERTGLKISGLKMLVPTREQAKEHYGKDDAWCEKVGQKTIDNMKESGQEPKMSAVEYGRQVLEGLYDYLTVGPAVALVAEGNQAVGVVKKIVGSTEPLGSDVGTIRGDFTLDSYQIANVDERAVRNLLHCSDEVAEAQREIDIWFSKEELVKYRHINEKMLYDVNIDGVIE